MATTSGKRKRDIVPADTVEYSLTPKRLEFEDSDDEDGGASSNGHHVDLDDDDVDADEDHYGLACPTVGRDNNFCGTSSGGSRRSLFGGSSPVNAHDGDDEDSENHPPLKEDSLIRCRPKPKLLFPTPSDGEASISFSPAKPDSTDSHTPMLPKPALTSPPTNGVRAMRIFDQQRIITSPVTAPRVTSDLVGHPHLRSRLLFDTSRQRRSEPAAHTDPVASPVTADPEAVAAAWTSLASSPLNRRHHTVSRDPRLRARDTQPRSVRKSRLANVNPFTPNSILRTAVRKRTVSNQSEDKKAFVPTGTYTPTWHGSFSHEDLQKSLDHLTNESLESTSVAAAAASCAASSSFVAVDHHVSAEEPADEDINPAKRLRVSDINISRYEEEFLELQEIASGVFGKVKVARHRLDGMIYAIKVTRQPIQGRNQERAAMNEVFAHAALMKHKHIVQYYNSWVENARIYIQNEYCEGGSLANAIKRKRAEGRTFSENELKRIALHLAKGLMYIHSKQLVHLDIKPENIFISLDYTPSSSPNVGGDGMCDDGTTATSSDLSFGPSSASSTPIAAKSAGLKRTLASDAASTSCPETSNKASKLSSPSVTAVEAPTNGNDSTDSGNHSGHECRSLCLAAAGGEMLEGGLLAGGPSGDSLERISYKIGDLGHVAPIYGDYIPEEGDCRYMAPELLLHEVDKERLPKADIFSLGLTLYECATLTDLPKNSMEDPIYERLKAGDLPFMPSYSKEFNQLIKSMVSPDMLARPSASRLVSHPYLKQHFSKTRSNLELYKELKSTRQRLKELEMQLSKANFVKRAVGKGTKKSASSYQ